jgi:hypothetical protein
MVEAHHGTPGARATSPARALLGVLVVNVGDTIADRQCCLSTDDR